MSPASVNKSLLNLSKFIQSLNLDAIQRDVQARAHWLTSLESTKWLKGIRQLLSTSLDVIKLILRGHHVRFIISKT